MSLDRYRTVGHSGLRVSPLAIGAMGWGDAVRGSDEQTSFAIMDRFVDLGGNFVDTSNAYVEGESESMLGRYFAARPGRRDRMVVSTKYAANLFPGDPNGGGTGRKALRHQIEGSLRRLGVDYIDLYWQHHWDRHTPIEETIAGLNDLVTAGKVLHIGFSDTPAWAAARAATIAQERGWAPVIALQLEYNLLARTVEGELFGLARNQRLGVIPFGPLASGTLSGKYSRSVREPEGTGRVALAAGYLDEQAFAALEVLQRIAEERSVSVAAVALAWVRQQELVTSILIGARSLRQFEDNVSSLTVTLSDKELSELGEITRPKLNFPSDFLDNIALNRQQGGATINGIPSMVYKPK